MKDRTVPGWVGALSGATLAGLATAIGRAPELTYLMDVHPGVAGWVQAVGSVGAIAVTACIFMTDQAARREAEERRIAELAKVVGQMSLHAAELVAARLSSALEPKVLYALRGNQTTEMVQSMREIDVKDLPPDIVKHFAYVRSGIYAVNARISEIYSSEKSDGRKIHQRRIRLMSSARVFHQTLGHLDNLQAAVGGKGGEVQVSAELRRLVKDALLETESSEAIGLD